MTSRNFEICIDANDPDLLRPFWRAALGYVEPQSLELLVTFTGGDPALTRETAKRLVARAVDVIVHLAAIWHDRS